MENKFVEKIIKNKVEDLTLKEIDNFIEENWLLWTMKFELSPCGQLTMIGKKEYIENNIDEIKRLIKFNEEDNVCENCGEIRSNHIDYFNTNKKDVCPYRKSMKFSRKKNGN